MNEEMQVTIPEVASVAEVPATPPEIVNDERRGCTSASNAPYDILCPGRHLAQKGIPDDTSADAAFGRAVHEALATGDTSKLDTQQLNIHESSLEITQHLVQQFFGPEADSLKRFVEQRYWCMVGKKWEHSGKPDLVLRSPTKALIIEYKTLPGDVEESPKNQQLRDQAVLVRGALMVNDNGVAVVQPMVTHSPSICQYDEASLAQAEAEMFLRVAASNNPESPRVAGPVQCKFCRARSTCPEYLKMTAVAAPNKPMHDLALVSVATWTPEQRALFCEHLPLAIKWLEECKNQIKKQMELEPDSVPGFVLEPGCIRRPVRDLPVLHERFIALGGKTEDFIACTSISKEGFEKQIRAVTKLKGKALAAKISELLDGVTDSKPDAPSIAKVK